MGSGKITLCQLQKGALSWTIHLSGSAKDSSTEKLESNLCTSHYVTSEFVSTTTPPTMTTNVSSQLISAPPLDTQISLSDLVFFNKRFNEMKSFFYEITERLTAKLDEQQRQLDELGPVKNLVEKPIREKEELAKHIRKNLSEPVR